MGAAIRGTLSVRSRGEEQRWKGSVVTSRRRIVYVSAASNTATMVWLKLLKVADSVQPI